MLLLLFTAGLSCHLYALEPLTSVSRVEVTTDSRLLVNGSPFFVIGCAPGPPIDLKTPEGGDGWAELAEGGLTVARSVVKGDEMSTPARAIFQANLDVAAAHGMYIWPFLHDSVMVRNPRDRERLSDIITKYKDHPGILMWKSSDEPEWGKQAPGPLIEARKIINQLDPNHPVWICQAPRGTTETLMPYRDAYDAISIDIYPVSEPAGKHSLLPNKGLSMVGDYTKRVMELGGPGKYPFMVLQVCWSGVTPTHNPKNRLMYPTPRQARYMMYQAIINGANGLSFFGFPVALTGRDHELGWNWTYWRAVMKPLLAEIKRGTELNLVLTSPDTTFPLSFTGAPHIEARWKEVGPFLYVFAAAREGETQEVQFSGIPDGEITVLQENRVIEAKGGSFSDTFREHDVHIYRIHRNVPSSEVKPTKTALPKKKGEAKSEASKTTIASEIYLPPGAEK